MAGVELLPGDLAEAILGQSALPETVKAFREELNLDLPWHERYFVWLWDMLQGDFGRSLANQREISELLGVRLWKSKDGGVKFTSDGHGRGVHVDHHAMWIDPKDGRHMILGNDGGIYVTNDRGKNWDHLNHVAIGQFYHVGVGPRRDYRVYGGLQDNGSWGGPSITRHARGPTNADWMRVGGGDGMYNEFDTCNNRFLYNESQFGPIGRLDLWTGERNAIRYDDAGKALIGGIRRVSKPGRRVYVGKDDVPQVRRGLGVAVISTSKGILSDQAAREASVGGELLCEVW